MKQNRIASVKKFVKRNKENLIILLVSAFLWSWIFIIDIANLAHTLVIGYVLMITVYLVMTSITVLFIIKFRKLFSAKVKQPSYKSIVYMVLVWAMFEFILAWVLSAIWMGINGSWDNIVPFVSLTPLIVLTPLRFLTRLFGFFGTSAVVGTGFIVAVACWKNKDWRKLALIYWVVVLCFNTALWVIYKNPSGPIINAVVTSEKLGEPQVVDATNSDIIVLPEYGLDHYTSNNIAERFKPSDTEVYFTGTKQYGENQGNSNVLIYGSDQKGFIKEHTKSRLIVGGEYLPFFVEIIIRTISPDVYSDFQVRRAINKGKDAMKPFPIPGSAVIGNAACSSIINPDDYRKLTADGATVLANSASLEIFRGSRVFALHHDGLAKFMATSNARPFLQSAHNWKAFALDHSGNNIAQVDPVGQANVSVHTNTKKTPYMYLGEWLAFVGIAFFVLMKVRLYTRKREP